MPRKNKTRKLWLKVRGNANVSRRAVLNNLIASIHRGDYVYPKAWSIGIGWSNKENGNLRWGEFTAEMRKSAALSPGFDLAVLQYLESLL